MEKKIFGILVLSILVMSAIPAMAYTTTNFRTYLTYKNPSDWSEIYRFMSPLLKAKVNLEGYFGNMLFFSCFGGLEPNTKYTLIYYGDATHNDVWPHATCIRTVTSSSNGQLSAYSAVFDYSSFIGDGVGQKFWLVPTKDLDCVNEKFIAWNPTEILFEHNTI